MSDHEQATADAENWRAKMMAAKDARSVPAYERPVAVDPELPVAGDA